jgi:large subunit ribosomal protein L19
MDVAVKKFEQKSLKPKLGAIQSGDTVRVHQTIREGGKTRIQVFEGMVIRTRKMGSLQASISVRRIASGIGVEKVFVLHSPNVVKVDVVRRNKVRRNVLSYMRQRSGKSTRLTEQEFDTAKAGVAEQKKEEPKAEKPAEESNDKLEADSKEIKEDKKADEEAKIKEKKEKAEAFRKAQEEKAKK